MKIFILTYLFGPEIELKGGVRLAVKIIELIGTSKNSWEDAVQEAVSKTAKTIHNIHAVDVLSLKANVESGKIAEYRANVKIAFVID